MSHEVGIAPGITAVVRDWLDANHAVVCGAGETVLIDTGCSAHADATIALVRAASPTRSVQRIINTHCHSDHMGGNARLSRAFGAPVTLPADAAPLIDRWDERELLLDYAGQHAERFDYADTISGGTTVTFGGIEWHALSAPGHDMTALVFFAPAQRVLVSGDALWEHGFGLIEPLEQLSERLAAQRATLECIRALDVATVIPGHGAPFSNVAAALDRAFQRLEAYERDPLKLARHVLKALFMFSLLARGSMPRSELARHFETVRCYVDYNARFFGLAPAALADMLVGELKRSRAIVEDGGLLTPA